MRASLPYALSGLAICSAVVNAAPFKPFKFPLPNGFPKADDALKLDLGKQAGGLLSNADPPTDVNPDILTSFRLVAFNELSEVAFFDSLLKNVTGKVKGYEIEDEKEYKLAVSSISNILAQEQLHALNANKVLDVNKAGPIEPCQYKFPVETYKDAIKLADTFTSVVLGTLGDFQFLAANEAGKDAAGIVRSVSTTLGQEGQQDGWFRTLQGKSPSAQPFLTSGVRDFAFTALQNFIVPDSCPNADTIKLKVFEKLAVTSDLKGLKKDAPVSFKATCNPNGEKFDEKEMSVVFINGARLPVVKPLKDVKKEGNLDYRFTAEFPDNVDVMHGLTYALVVKGAPEGLKFKTPDDVAKATVFGPALIMAEDAEEAEEESKPPTYGDEQVKPPKYGEQPVKVPKDQDEGENKDGKDDGKDKDKGEEEKKEGEPAKPYRKPEGGKDDGK